MSTQDIESLVMEKIQAQQTAQQLLNVLGAVALANGKQESKNVTRLRIPKPALNRLNGHRIELKGLKSGGVIVTVRRPDET